jgi:hypothetical protein
MGYTITCNKCGEVFNIHVTEVKFSYDNKYDEINRRNPMSSYTYCPNCNVQLILD